MDKSFIRITESNSNYDHIENFSTTEILQNINAEDKKVAYAVEQNLCGQNCYVGAALRKPDTPEMARASTKHFLNATAMRVDADTNAAAVRTSAAAISRSLLRWIFTPLALAVLGNASSATTRTGTL